MKFSFLNIIMVSSVIFNIHSSMYEISIYLSGKNAAFVRLVRCRSLEEEYSNKSTKYTEIGKNI